MKSSSETFIEVEKDTTFTIARELKFIFKIRFKYRNELLYYINFDNERKRLCISIALKHEIFSLTHD